MPDNFDPQDYETLRRMPVGDYLITLKRDRMWDALKWPMILLMLMLLMVGTAWGIGHVVSKLTDAPISLNESHHATERTDNPH